MRLRTEPPYAERHVRWCERREKIPPTRCVPSMAFNLTVKVRYGGTYQPTISEAQAIHREVEVKEVCSKILAR